jgi:hypothetical protein
VSAVTPLDRPDRAGAQLDRGAFGTVGDDTPAVGVALGSLGVGLPVDGDAGAVEVRRSAAVGGPSDVAFTTRPTTGVGDLDLAFEVQHRAPAEVNAIAGELALQASPAA